MRQPRQHGEQQGEHQLAEPPQHDQRHQTAEQNAHRQQRIAGVEPEQRAEDQAGDDHHHPARRRDRVELPAQYLECADPLEPQQGRAGEANQHRQRGEYAHQPGHAAGRGQFQRQETRQQCQQRGLPSEPQQRPDGRRDQPQPRQLPGEELAQLALGRAETAQQRGRVQMAVDIASRGHGDRDTGEQHRRQPGEAEVFLRPIQRPPQAGPVHAHVANLDARVAQRIEPAFETIDRRRRPGGQYFVFDPRAGPDQSGRLEILQVEHDARRQAGESALLVRLALDQPGNGQRKRADLHRVADTGIQQLRQPWRDPGATRWRAVRQPFDTVAPVDANLPVERIMVVHHLEPGRLEGIRLADHRYQVDLIAQFEPGLAQRLAEFVVEGLALLQH